MTAARVRIGVGLDGCRGGWVVALLRRGAEAPCTPELHVITRIEALDGLLAERRVRPPRCLIDIPVGLVAAGRRSVDDAARQAIGTKASSVFTVPPRAVFDALDFDEANRLARATMGQGLSVQAWNIMPKIREVDLYLRRRAPAPALLVESHPELAFARLAALAAEAGIAAAAPGLPGKKSRAGFEARLDLLAAWGVDARTAVASPPAHPEGRIARDDLLDAVALALVATLPDAQLAVLGTAEETDPLGLPLQMLVPREVRSGG
ncbi:MAG TPA: DUF429 domain-containing protein [Pseudomonadales bacterium]|nr:DUF429 domain-containing protein [Pseudomonadales bacterium]